MAIFHRAPRALISSVEELARDLPMVKTSRDFAFYGVFAFRNDPPSFSGSGPTLSVRLKLSETHVFLPLRWYVALSPFLQLGESACQRSF